jgi:hypothetical protein
VIFAALYYRLPLTGDEFMTFSTVESNTATKQKDVTCVSTIRLIRLMSPCGVLVVPSIFSVN